MTKLISKLRKKIINIIDDVFKNKIKKLQIIPMDLIRGKLK